MGVFTYPWPHELIVGTAPDRLKVFSPIEVRALLVAFQKHTGVNPLETACRLDRVLDVTNAVEKLDAQEGSQ